MEPVFGLDIRLPARGSRQRLRALHAQLRDGIAQGRLHAGLLLPSTRELARAHGVSRNTAVAAYDLLAAEGYVVTRAGGGTFVAAVVPRTVQRVNLSVHDGADRRLVAYWRNRRLTPSPAPGPAVEFDFALGLPDKGEFPFQIWRRLSARALRVLSRTPAAYAEPEGRESLRQAVSPYVSYARAVSCTADDVVITSGAQQAFDLLARVLVTPEKTIVAVEDPGYPPMRRVFEAAGPGSPQSRWTPRGCRSTGSRPPRGSSASRPRISFRSGWHCRWRGARRSSSSRGEATPSSSRTTTTASSATGASA